MSSSTINESVILSQIILHIEAAHDLLIMQELSGSRYLALQEMGNLKPDDQHRID